MGNESTFRALQGYFFRYNFAKIFLYIRYNIQEGVLHFLHLYFSRYREPAKVKV